MDATTREALAGVRKQLEQDHAEATAAIEAGTATPWECGRHYQAAQAAGYLAAAGLWGGFSNPITGGGDQAAGRGQPGGSRGQE